MSDQNDGHATEDGKTRADALVPETVEADADTVTIARDLGDGLVERRVREGQEALLRSILETVPDALIVIDDRGQIRSFSPAAERLFGFTAAEVSGHNVNMLMPSPYRDQHDGYMRHYLTTGERRIIGIGRVVVGRRKDGSTFPMQLSVGEAKLPDRRLFTGFVRDLTERQDRERRIDELREQLAHGARLNELGHMAAALAHEVNQPLTAIANYAAGARRLLAADNPKAAQVALDRIIEQASRAHQIVQRLREFVRKGEAERSVENLPRLVEEAAALALVGVGPDLKLALRFGQGVDMAFIDRVQIQQILFNLIRNAVEAMAASPRRELTISTGLAGEMIEICVADSGPGLPDQVRERLFQPFVTTKAAGMGVGLSICRVIAEAHAGTLEAEDRPGGGTVFRLRIPASAARPADG